MKARTTERTERNLNPLLQQALAAGKPTQRLYGQWT